MTWPARARLQMCDVETLAWAQVGVGDSDGLLENLWYRTWWYLEVLTGESADTAGGGSHAWDSVTDTKRGACGCVSGQRADTRPPRREGDKGVPGQLC